MLYWPQNQSLNEAQVPCIVSRTAVLAKPRKEGSLVLIQDSSEPLLVRLNSHAAQACARLGVRPFLAEALPPEILIRFCRISVGLRQTS